MAHTSKCTGLLEQMLGRARKCRQIAKGLSKVSKRQKLAQVAVLTHARKCTKWHEKMLKEQRLA